MSSGASRSHLRMRKIVAVVLGATISMAAVTAIAVEDQAGAAPNKAACDAFKSATEAAMKNHLTIVNQFMGSANSSMQAAVSKSNSCIGNLAMLDFDLSKLIPDFGMLGTLLQTAIDKLVTGVINRACNAISDVVNKPSEIWNDIMDKLPNTNDQFQNWAGGIDYTLPGGTGNSGGSNSGGGSGSGSGSGSAVGGGEVTCTETIAGKTCTDGTFTPGNDDIVTESPSGAQIGARYVYLTDACTNSLNQDTATGDGSAVSPASQAACQELQAYINQYAIYLDPNSAPKYPNYPIYMPGNAGSASSIGGGSGSGGAVFGGSAAKKAPATSSYSLPVRQ